MTLPGIEAYGKSWRHGVLIWFPPGTKGEHEEIEIVEFLHDHREIGYGRMIQMLDQMWKAKDKNYITSREAYTKSEALTKEIEQLKTDLVDANEKVLSHTHYCFFMHLKRKYIKLKNQLEHFEKLGELYARWNVDEERGRNS